MLGWRFYKTLPWKETDLVHPASYAPNWRWLTWQPRQTWLPFVWEAEIHELPRARKDRTIPVYVQKRDGWQDLAARTFRQRKRYSIWRACERIRKSSERFLGWSCLDFRVGETRRWLQKGTSQDKIFGNKLNDIFAVGSIRSRRKNESGNILMTTMLLKFLSLFL